MRSEKGDGPKSQKGLPDPRLTLSVAACGSGKIVKIVGLDLGTSPDPVYARFSNCRMSASSR
jgi:hypothetical protein